jgi:hypothetical protein
MFVSGLGLDSYFSLLSYFYSIICSGVISDIAVKVLEQLGFLFSNSSARHGALEAT